MVNKKVVIFVTFIALLITGCIVGIGVYYLNNTKYVADIFEDESKIKINEEITVAEKEESKIDANSSENTIKENSNSSEKMENETNTIGNLNESSTDTQNENNQNDLEKEAISLAKKKWGNSNKNVYFYIEDEVDDGIYIITVRDDDTTAELKAYRVDVNNKKVKESN